MFQREGEISMTNLIKFICQNRIIFSLLLWCRGLLSENKIPNTLFERLKKYTPELSENIPNLEVINRYLENDISYLNNIEEFINIRELNKLKSSKKAQNNIARKYQRHKAKKFNSVRIVGYQDILELESIRDRVFVLDIDMLMDDPSSFYNLYKQNKDFTKSLYYYSVKLSSLVSIF